MAKLMSDRLREELSRELGVEHIVRTSGWGGVSARDCGRLVQLAVARAEKALRQKVRG
jgi:small acid-soluble spore protein F (minor alpha/beta-type SASP)